MLVSIVRHSVKFSVDHTFVYKLLFHYELSYLDTSDWGGQFYEKSYPWYYVAQLTVDPQLSLG